MSVQAGSAGRTCASCEWEYGLDGVTWTKLAPSVRADKVVDGRSPGTVYFFRYRALTKAGLGDDSQVVTRLVD